VHLYCSFPLDCDEACVGKLGADEAEALAFVEATLKYQPDNFAGLTLAHYLGWGQCMVGSLTGAVSSQRVTEECKGTLSAVGHRA
jgi:hypothetical protein